MHALKHMACMSHAWHVYKCMHATWHVHMYTCICFLGGPPKFQAKGSMRF